MYTRSHRQNILYITKDISYNKQASVIALYIMLYYMHQEATASNQERCATSHAHGALVDIATGTVEALHLTNVTS